MFHTFFTKYKRPLFYGFCKVAADRIRYSYFEPRQVPIHPLSDPARHSEIRMRELAKEMERKAKRAEMERAKKRAIIRREEIADQRGIATHSHYHPHCDPSKPKNVFRSRPVRVLESASWATNRSPAINASGGLRGSSATRKRRR